MLRNIGPILVIIGPMITFLSLFLLKNRIMIIKKAGIITFLSSMIKSISSKLLKRKEYLKVLTLSTPNFSVPAYMTCRL